MSHEVRGFPANLPFTICFYRDTAQAPDRNAATPSIASTRLTRC
ncbi:MAG: hypothetical protein JWP86_1352, partial [Phenylobacterium sp.]|nr:hypothetical protein [Phenylobacterium sp.]